MSVRDNLPPGPGPGRRKGVPNKKNRDIAAAYEKILTDSAYRESLRRRLIRGTAGAMEVTMHHYVYGKPKEQHEVTGADQGPLVISWKSHKDPEDT